MTTLRNLNRAVQSAEFPSHEWAQAVREMLNEIAERMEPTSGGAKVECPNCGQPGEHYHSGDMPHVPAFYTCQPAQPEPAAPSGMPEAVRHPVARAVDALITASEYYEDEESIAVCVQAAEDLESWWRSQPTPALRMTPELERVLQQTIATAEHFLTMPGTVSGVGQNLLRDVRAVRAQASQPVKLEKVRRALKCGQERLNIVFLSEETTTRWNNLFYEALAELDAAEGKAETKEGK